MWYWIIGIGYILDFITKILFVCPTSKNRGLNFIFYCICYSFYIYFWFTRRYRQLVVATIIFVSIYLVVYLIGYFAGKNQKGINEGEEKNEQKVD